MIADAYTYVIYRRVSVVRWFELNPSAALQTLYSTLSAKQATLVPPLITLRKTFIAHGYSADMAILLVHQRPSICP